MGGAYHVFFIWLKQGVGCGLSSRPPSKSKGNCTAGGRAIIVYRRVACSAWKCVYIRRRNIDVEYGCFVFCLFVPPHRCGSTREAMRNGEKVVIVSIIDKRRIISQQSGSRNGLKGPRRSPHKFFYFILFFFCCQLRESSMISLISGGKSNGVRPCMFTAAGWINSTSMSGAAQQTNPRGDLMIVVTHGNGSKQEKREKTLETRQRTADDATVFISN